MNGLTKKVLLLLEMWDDPQASDKDLERNLKVKASNMSLEQIMNELITAHLQSQKEISIATNTLRDEFAAKALTGILASQTKFRGNFAVNEKNEAKNIAKECYVLADALIEERLKKS